MDQILKSGCPTILMVISQVFRELISNRYQQSKYIVDELACKVILLGSGYKYRNRKRKAAPGRR